MSEKTYNIHDILEFCNRAELTLEEFELSYEEEFADLTKRGITIELDEPYGLAISPKVRRAQIGSGIFTIGIYPEIKLPPPEPSPLAHIGTSMSASYTDNDGKEHRFRMYLPDPKEWLKNERQKGEIKSEASQSADSPPLAVPPQPSPKSNDTKDAAGSKELEELDLRRHKIEKAINLIQIGEYSAFLYALVTSFVFFNPDSLSGSLLSTLIWGPALLLCIQIEKNVVGVMRESKQRISERITQIQNSDSGSIT